MPNNISVKITLISNIYWLSTWNVKGTFEEGVLKVLVRELKRYQVRVLAVQETKKGNECIDVDY